MRSSNKWTLLALALSDLCAGTYVLQDDYQPKTWFDQFNFFTSSDPTGSFVTYVDRLQAEKEGLIAVRDNSVYLGVDSKDVATGSGRKSVRLETKKTYNHGLIIADIAHMPGGECGTWPAFWTTASKWPEHGELDIIEGVNRQPHNDFALHTSEGCSIDKSGNFTGNVITPNCDVKAPGQSENQGCLFEAPGNKDYGPAFNKNKGGVYATQWTSAGVSIYFFPREKHPADINSQHPDPSSWGKPVAEFSGNCDIDKHFLDQRIIINTAFCGGWAESTWNSDPVCKAKGSCTDWVKNNPKAFQEAYWSINYLKVYQDKNIPPPSSSPSSSAAPPPPATSEESKPTTTSTTTSTSISTTTITPGATDGGAEPTHTTAVQRPAESDNGSHPGKGQTKCTTYTTLTTVAIVKTVTDEPQAPTKSAIIPLPSNSNDKKDRYARHRRREFSRHAGRNHR